MKISGKDLVTIVVQAAVANKTNEIRQALQIEGNDNFELPELYEIASRHGVPEESIDFELEKLHPGIDKRLENNYVYAIEYSNIPSVVENLPFEERFDGKRRLSRSDVKYIGEDYQQALEEVRDMNPALNNLRIKRSRIGNILGASIINLYFGIFQKDKIARIKIERNEPLRNFFVNLDVHHYMFFEFFGDAMNEKNSQYKEAGAFYKQIVITKTSPYVPAKNLTKHL